ncbi:unnamed protein product [Clavelina lepadiformis]|uniref:Uncharacterized protein n=1 Tax=Clavelina lepadiformis TaxID=159417 RepID=A0ABP0F049_CLALP
MSHLQPMQHSLDPADGHLDNVIFGQINLNDGDDELLGLQPPLEATMTDEQISSNSFRGGIRERYGFKETSIAVNTCKDVFVTVGGWEWSNQVDCNIIKSTIGNLKYPRSGFGVAENFSFLAAWALLNPGQPKSNHTTIIPINGNPDFLLQQEKEHCTSEEQVARREVHSKTSSDYYYSATLDVL